MDAGREQSRGHVGGVRYKTSNTARPDYDNRNLVLQVLIRARVMASRDTKLLDGVLTQRDAKAGYSWRRQHTVDKGKVLDRQIATQPGVGKFLGQALNERTIAGGDREVQGCGDADGRLPAMGYHHNATIARLVGDPARLGSNRRPCRHPAG